MTATRTAGTDYERSDASPRLIGWIGAGIIVSVAGLCLMLRLVFPESLTDRPTLTPIEPPAPRLQTDPREDLRRLRAGEEERLSSYGWIDRDHGIVHIPIEQAKRILARQAGAGTAGEKP